MKPRVLALYGRDYPDLGPLGLVGLPGGGAIALSRGRYPKPYAHVDPNEDAALIAPTPDGVVLAVADGHSGAEGAERALELTAMRAHRLAVPDAAAFRDAALALYEDLDGMLRGGRSRTCLVLAAVLGKRCHWASFGDSCALRAARSEPVTAPNGWVPGYGRSPRDGEPEAWSGSFRCEPGERVALASDGVTSFAPDLSHLSRALGEAPDDLRAARAIAEAALDGGAGDNVAVVVFRAG